MKWQKRECPIHMELVPYGAGWEDITLDICGDHHWWSVSGCLGNGFGALVESLYALYPDQTHDEEEQRWLSEIDDYVVENKDDGIEVLRHRTESDRSYCSFPRSAEFFWDEEGHVVNWRLTRVPGADKDCLLTVELEESGSVGDKKSSRYEVMYSDLCYAVGRAVTEALNFSKFAH